MTPGFSEDIRKAKAALAGLPRVWDGRQCILEMKEADYHWKQMEWWAFYFEFLCRHRLGRDFQIPGEKFRTVEFDLKGSVNWDLKAKAIKSDEHSCILNDCSAIEASIQTHQEHGVIIALCDVEYNDVNRSFQQWHSELKGGLSAYEQARRRRTNVSRYRKTKAELSQVLFVRLDKEVIGRLGQMRQGRNSNGAPRPPKYLLDLEEHGDLVVGSIDFD